MKVKCVYWEADNNSVTIKEYGEFMVSKFNVGCCMEKWFEDMDGFSWSENGDSYKWDESKGCIVVENADGEMKWVFIKE